jgi:very-short-patch-repair endonuclease
VDISELTRRDIIDYLISRGYPFHGRLELLDFLEKVWDLYSMPSTDPRYKNAYDDICKHMRANDDWDENYLLWKYLNLSDCEDALFLKFLEECIHPVVLADSKQINEALSEFNKYLLGDNYQLEEMSQLSGRPIYKAVRIDPKKRGVREPVKNLIFAATVNTPKPDIVLSNSVSNRVKIVNSSDCLLYNRPIRKHGLLWKELVDWWQEEYTKDIGLSRDRDALENDLYRRLAQALPSNSPPQQLLFEEYFRNFCKRLGDSFPALIPEVYLHYDPYTLKQRSGEKQLPRQRMDFLLLLSDRDHILIEVDGKHHYSKKDREGRDIADPQTYAEMVSEDRKLRLEGYEVYRFGGFELQGESGKTLVVEFFNQLFKKHSILL